MCRFGEVLVATINSYNLWVIDVRYIDQTRVLA